MVPHQLGNELEMQKLRTGPFWERVTYIFNYLDAFLNGLGDGIVTVGTFLPSIDLSLSCQLSLLLSLSPFLSLLNSHDLS